MSFARNKISAMNISFLFIHETDILTYSVNINLTHEQLSISTCTEIINKPPVVTSIDILSLDMWNLVKSYCSLSK